MYFRTTVDDLPLQLIIDKKSIAELTYDNTHMIMDWMKLITHYDFDNKNVEIVLGRVGYPDFFHYDYHMQGRKREFKQIHSRYGLDKGYDIDKLQKDLKLLNNITFFTGKYPLLSPVKLCKDIVIEEGAGSLQKKIEFRYEGIIQKERLDSFIKEEMGEWFTVFFKDMNAVIARQTKKIIRAINWELFKSQNKKFSDVLKKSEHFLEFKNISIEALELSAKYFRHLKPKEDL